MLTPDMESLSFLFPHPPAVIAHRGASRRAPENTLEAFRLAFQMGADAIELDVRLSRDGVPVVIHDAQVERTTDGTGKVQDLTWPELRELDAGAWFAAAFCGARIPELAAVLEDSARSGWINIELKNYATRGDDLEKAVVDLVRRTGLGRRVLLSSFNPLSLRAVARLAPDVPRALLTTESLPIYLRRGWFAFLARPDAYNLHGGQANMQSVSRIRSRGSRVCVWTVNDPAEAHRLHEAGVDGIITDEPDTILAAVGRKGRA
jgi:glycerophosphoryl diester phosphodiesterase